MYFHLVYLFIFIFFGLQHYHCSWQSICQCQLQDNFFIFQKKEKKVKTLLLQIEMLYCKFNLYWCLGLLQGT